MKHEYQGDFSSYEEARYKLLCAILKSQLGIEINDFGGMLQIKKDDKLVASMQIIDWVKRMGGHIPKIQ